MAKKIRSVIVLFLLASCFVFTACDPNEFCFNYDEIKDAIVRVELINYNNSEVKKLFEKRDKVISFDFEKMETLEVLHEAKIDELLRDFSKIIFMEYWRHFDSPQGICLRLVYSNGDFEIISQYEYFYAGSFGADGNVKRFIGGLSNKKDLMNLINKYFVIQVE